MCLDPGVPNQGMRVGDNFQHGKTVTFECKKNYDLLGNATVRCNDGVWNGETPKCKGNYKNNPYLCPYLIEWICGTDISLTVWSQRPWKPHATYLLLPLIPLRDSFEVHNC